MPAVGQDIIQAFALGLAAASEQFRKDLCAKVIPDAFSNGPQRQLFEAMAANDGKAMVQALHKMGVDVQSGEKVQACVLRILEDHGQRQKVESILYRVRAACALAGPEAAMKQARELFALEK